MQARRGRPPKTARNFDDTKEALLLAGMAILTERGFNTVGIDMILKRVGVPKGSFYHYFKNKDDFGLQVIGRYDDYFCAKLRRCLASNPLSPLDGIMTFVNEAIEGIEKYRFSRGCLIGNFGQEMPILSEHFKQPLEQCLKHWSSLLAQNLEQAKSLGMIASTVNSTNQAEFFWIGWEGAILTAKVMQSVQPMRKFADGFMQQLSTTQ
ncbi:acrylate utilization transcriptional regulator AcuR [Alteromonas gilva]|uniref:TetR family transcriptional regulator C-terminal domain-containing protein n=1 Tax=Alteromonas gilva TaxID=2987522 RepID=A0ABT5L3T9_9ALTE|nr:TetR/AcrR family transcriptional regulator [Alteromonas gilva]MDC8831066.1 TetR family transcriptional regulator C-terminal domain-containing protein [Alteromonas gilva]